MSSKYASGKKALGICDRCGFEYKLKELKPLYVNGANTNLLVCPTDWEPDHPQNMLGRYIVNDPQALYKPRPDSYEDNRNIQWGWNPVGFYDFYNLGITDNLKGSGVVGTVTVTT